jgi:PLP dependent protein
MVNEEKYIEINKSLTAKKVILVAVSKLKPASDITILYNLGHRDFGENYVQELVDKAAQLPTDILWHFIGHLQSNKVKYIAPFVHLIQGVDSEKLLGEINKQAEKNNRIINVLLQVHIAMEETKFGFDEAEINNIDLDKYTHVKIVGLMGMASFTENKDQVKKEFESLQSLFEKINTEKNIALTTLSMGMSNDYELAINSGSNMVRIGSLLFGNRG